MIFGIGLIKVVMCVLCVWFVMVGSVVVVGFVGYWDIGLYGNLFGSCEYQVWVFVDYQVIWLLLLLLVLYGCVIGFNFMGEVFGFNDVVDIEGFIVVYLCQNVIVNLVCCWNWQLLINQVCGSGEVLILVGIVDVVKVGYSVDLCWVYVIGILVGGVMILIMLVCYLDVFVVGVIYFGGMYKGVIMVFGSVYVLLVGSIYLLDSNGWFVWQCVGLLLF